MADSTPQVVTVGRGSDTHLSDGRDYPDGRTLCGRPWTDTWEPGTAVTCRKCQTTRGATLRAGRLTDWTAPYTVTAPDAETAREYITRRAMADAADASVEFVRGPVRDRGPRSYWRATVRRVRTVTGD